MTYKWFTFRFTKNRQRNDNTIDSGNREPLDHPVLSRMTLAELADLPMPAYTKENCTGNVRVI
jgi:hypothetical protein